MVYEVVCMGLFEKDRVMFTFHMLTMIMDANNSLNKTELDFFLKGNTSLNANEEQKPYIWLSDNGWKDIQKLKGLEEVGNEFI